MLLKSASQYKPSRIPLSKPSHYRTHSSSIYIPSLCRKKKQKSKKKHQRASSSIFELTPLKGKNIVKAPKIYSNQIFSDIYDEKGNHDRIVELTAEDADFDYQKLYIVPELLQLPTIGRNKATKIIF